jgi:two-component system, OmpR family, sensor kinase
MSLRLRLLLILAPLFVAGLLAADIGTFTALRSSLLAGVQAQLKDSEAPVELSLEGRGGGDFGGPGGGPAAFPQYTWGELLSPSGAVVGGPHCFVFSTTPSSAQPVLPQTLELDSYVTVPGKNGINRYYLWAGPSVDGNGNTLLIAIPLDNVNSTLNSLLIFEILISGGITLLVIVATWLMVRRGLRPLERMGATARSIAATDLSRRVAPSNEQTEVGRLGLALNTMLAQLESAFASRAASERRLRRFVSDASHELRTPLTSMRGYAELIRRNPDITRQDVALALERIEKETERMGVLVDDLLLLARLDQGRPLEREPVDLDALVRDACADARATDPARTITARLDEPIVVPGDDMRLRQAVGNLVRNALVHTPAGTPIELTLKADDGRALISVIDHGPGIPPDQRPLIFERFVQADGGRSRDRGGSGLGLSIAAAVVGAHHGTISVEETPGGGATFRIGLPSEGS